MSVKRFFVYQWHIDENEPEITSIRMYGLNDKNENVCVRVNNFTPYVYLELSEKINWQLGYAQLLGSALDKLMGDKKPLVKSLIYKHRLYGAHLIKNDKGEWVRKKFPYLFCSFSNKNDAKILGYKIKNPITIPGLGPIRLKMHEQDADPILQLTCCRNIPTAGWIEFVGKEILGENKVTLCDHEYNVLYKNLKSYESDMIPSPKVMSYDCEVNSTNPNTMPNEKKPGDKIFQISSVIGRSDVTVEKHTKYLQTLGDPDQALVGEDVIIERFNTEADLLIGWKTLIRKENPNILAGYNIMTFDIPYMVARAKLNLCIFDFDQLGFHKYAHAKETLIKWSSSAYKNQKFIFLDAEGRLFVDLLPLVRRDYKLSTYKLKTIASMFIGETKDPLTHKGIFKCYRLGTTKQADGTYSKMARKAISICSKYCVQDSVLVSKLLDKRKDWIALVESAKVCKTTIFDLYTKGQQIKVYSQMYHYSMYEDIIVEKDAYFVGENERYVGAHVFPPVPGCYENVVPEDFSSLYPSLMIAYNIGYDSWVKDDSAIPDSMCHVHEWHDHVSCSHDPKVIRKNEITKYIDEEKKLIKALRDKRNSLKKDKPKQQELALEIKNRVDALKPYTQERSDITKSLSKHPMCEKRYFRWLKGPLGALPTIVKNFLDARAAVRGKQKDINKKIAELEKQEGKQEEILELRKMWDILEKRQLAFKVAANSSYGITGTRKGYLPFMPAAMCITYMGRVNICIVAKTIQEKYNGHLVYGDSVTGDTPILCRYKGKIMYRTIDNLPCSEYQVYRDSKEEAKPCEGLEVWTEKGFTTIKNIIRHKTTKKIYRVLTHTGVVDVTEDHGLLDKNANKVSALELDIGSELLTHDLPICEQEMHKLGALTRKDGEYYGKEHKDIPNCVLEYNKVEKQEFFIGYLGHWYRKGNFAISTSKKLQAAKLYYLGALIGYNVSIDISGNVLNLTFSKDKHTQPENQVKKIVCLGEVDDYVYDLETENHHFSAGVGKLIVHNTDSNYVNFPHLKTSQEVWDMAVKISEEVSKLFPPPMKLEFENKIYSFFLIITKKRYMYRECDREGKIKSKIGSKGVLLARRDNSQFVREVYENVIGMIADGRTKDEVFYYVLTELNLLCSHSKPLAHFVITKAVGDIGDITPVPFINEKGKKKAKIGDYTVPILEDSTMEEQFRKKGVNNEKDFYLSCLPAQVQLAERMRKRGQRVDPGTRLEYVVADPENHTANQYKKVESAEYIAKFGSVIKLDYLYYIHALSTPLDQVLSVVYKEDKDFVLKQYKYRWQVRKKVMDELIDLFRPVFVYK